jgi:hypothetical protein
MNAVEGLEALLVGLGTLLVAVGLDTSALGVAVHTLPEGGRRTTAE